MAAEAKVRLSVTGSRRARQLLQGISREARNLGREQKRISRDVGRETERTETDKQHAMRRTSSLAKSFDRDQLASARRMGREIARESERMSRNRISDLRRVQQKAIELARKETSGLKKEYERRRGILAGAVAGGVVGAGRGLANLGRNSVAIAGGKTRDQRIADGAQFDISMRRLQSQSGMSDTQRETLEGRILGASVKHGADQGDVLRGVQTIQAKFPESFAQLSGNLDKLVGYSMALGEPLEDLIGLAGNAARQYGLDAKGTSDAVDFAAVGAAQGTIEIGDLARELAKGMGGHALLTGASGLEGFKEYVGIGEAVATGGGEASEVNTYIQALISALSDKNNRKELASFLGGSDLASNRALAQRVGDPNATLRIPEVIAALARDDRFSGARAGQVFSRKEALLAALPLVAQERALMAGDSQNVAASRISALDPAVGTRLMAEQYANVDDSVAMDWARNNAKIQAETTKNIENYGAHVSFWAKTMGWLEESVGEFGMYADLIAQTAGSAGAGALLMSLLKGGGGGTLAKLGTTGRGALTAGAALLPSLLVGASGIAAFLGTDYALGGEDSDARKAFRGVGEDFAGTALGEWFAEAAGIRPEGADDGGIAREYMKFEQTRSDEQLRVMKEHLRVAQATQRMLEQPGGGHPPAMPLPGRGD